MLNKHIIDILINTIKNHILFSYFFIFSISRSLYCFDMNASDEHKMFVNDTTNLSWAADFQRGTSGHAYKADQAIDGFKFFANSGNLRCGYFRVYGIVNR